MTGAFKPLASLSSGLLARKGQARPAMRPQGFAGLTPAAPLDDLGWNDMGVADEPPAPEPVRPPVLKQREELEAAVAASEPAPAISAETVAAIGQEAPRAGKAAFTLRLPADRHLRLRLASALQRRSAQAIVTDALDQYLASLPQVEALACRSASQATHDLPGK